MAKFDMEKYNQWPANHKNDAVPSKKIIALGRKITDVAAHKIGGVKVSDPEYWGLAEIISEEMADIALKMKLRTPYTFPEMVKLCKVEPREEEHFQKLLDEMSYIGLLEYDYGYHYDHNGRTHEQTGRRYILTMFVPGSAEMFSMEESPDQSDHRNYRLEQHPDIASFFERMTYLPLDGITQMVPPGGAGIGMHVIPVEKAIEMENTSIDIEHLSYWLKKYEGHIGVGRCSCRAIRKVLGEGCADDDYGWCIGVGDFADYCRETGKGHDITYDEAMAILQRAEENGFVHQVTNIDGENKIFGICNCNVNICNALRTSQLFNTPNMSRSAYVAHVDKDKCVACGRCVEYCPAGATRLGQKLCKKDGTEVKYPKVELPDAVKWGPEKYDPDYRDNNRINTHESGTAPCKANCPAHIAVQGYLKLAAQGKYEEALALIKKQNPLPAICGHVCNRRCEDACTRGTIDEAVSIDAVKKFLAERDLKSETRYIPEKTIPASIHRTKFDEKVAIIGGGPAGLSAANYLALKGYYPTIFEKNEFAGGMVEYGIPSFKLEKSVVQAEIDVIKELGVEIKTGVEVGKDVTIDELRAQGYKAFYVATGLQSGGKLNVEGADAEGVMAGIDYLKKVHDGERSLKGKVIVIGGGSIGCDVARSAKRSGADVTLYCLEQYDEMPMGPIDQAELEEDKIKVCAGWGPASIASKDGKVTGITFKKCTQTKNAEGRFDPKFDENDTVTEDCVMVLYATGQKPELKNMLDGQGVKFTARGLVEADALTYQTAKEDIFVGGDIYTGQKFAIDAIAAGKKAAETIHRFVQGGHMTIGLNHWEFDELDKDDISILSYDNAGRQQTGIDKKIAKDPFKDAHTTLTEEQVKIETARCLGCGATEVDFNKCIGCGVCTTKCAFDAIHLHRDNPECSKMVPAEDKFKHIIPYQIKRAAKIAVNERKAKRK